MNENECKGCADRHRMLVIFAEKIDEQTQEIERLKAELEAIPVKIEAALDTVEAQLVSALERCDHV